MHNNQRWKVLVTHSYGKTDKHYELPNKSLHQVLSDLEYRDTVIAICIYKTHIYGTMSQTLPSERSTD